MAEEGKVQREFQAEVRKVLHILTHSLYSNREIFLRELISNASDALDKLRFRVNKGEQPRLPELPLEIRITLDKEAKTLTIADTGLGMTAEELAENLGTIAKSGSEQFLADLAGAQTSGEDGAVADAANIIGRFGVGFYSVFMIADKVEVTSRPAFADEGVAAHVWTSDGLGTFTVEESTGEKPERGTIIKAYLKTDAGEYADKYRIEEIIRTHSAFIPFPIFVDGDQANTQAAIWREPKSAVSQEQYNNFYKALTYDRTDPLDEQHISVDVPVQFTALLYTPATESEIYAGKRDHWGLDLYARRVLIQHDNKELLPEYLSFLKGVVDTEDLPLNISRETLQENVILQKINQVITKQTLGYLEKMAGEDADKYNTFWHLHGKILKLGYTDYINRDRVAGLLRFNSSALPEAKDLTSLQGYMDRAPADQKTFWFATAPNREAAKMNPHMEIFRKKGIEVLFLFEPVDEFVVEGIGTYKEWTFKSIESVKPDELDKFADTESAGEAVSQLSDEDKGAFEELLKRMKEILGDKVTEVRVSQRLADSPALLVSPDGAMSSSMEKLFKIMQKDDSIPVKVLEVNRENPLLRNMLAIFKADNTDPALESMTRALFDSCLLMDGYLKDPQSFALQLNGLLTNASAWYKEVKKI
ncbi:MAG: molecular chaperone HtpG [Desulfovibrio sp.]|nr:molecular chaperone HtpG [Desulfovibrio sp.]